MTSVSVVIPTFNNDRHIGPTMTSVLGQTFTDFELIVSDHGSTDSTMEIVRSFGGDPRVRIVTTPPGGGAARNWNRVSQEAGAEFVKLVCGDDLLHPQALECQVDALRTHPGCALVASPRRIIRGDGTILLNRRGLGGMQGVVGVGEVVHRLVRAGTNLLGEPVCVLMRTEALEAAGWWDGRLPYVIDQLTYVRVLASGDMFALDEVLASFRVSPGQWSVALAGQQSDNLHLFHAWAREQYPESVSKADARVGGLRARANAAGRRVVYRMKG